MVHFETLSGETDMALAMRLAHDMAALITTKMHKPMEIVFEKIYYPYLLIEPKNYVGQLWMEPDKPRYIDVKGLETKKRDTPPFVERTMNAAIDKLMRERSVEAACAVVRRELVALRTDALPLADYEITKAYGKTYAEYDNPLAMPHLWTHRKLEAEQLGTGPLLGDRVPYVVHTDDNEPAHTVRAIDPAQLQRLGLCVDRHYYETQKMVNPLCRLLDIPLGGAGTTRRHVFEHPDTLQYRVTLRSGGIQRYAMA
jgi:DNA polymerase delta subunit 1